MKLCSGCKRKRPDGDFYTDQLTRRSARCKECKRASVAARQKRLKDEGRCFHCAQPMDFDDVTLCKVCKERRREEYHADGDRRREVGRQRKRNLRMAAFYAYGGPVCACCGEDRYEFLTIDHVNGDGGKHRRRLKKKHGYVVEIYRWLKNNRYPKGFQVLCWNCNCAKAHFGQCPHQAERSGATEVAS